MSDWTDFQGAPFVTVSPTGLASGLEPNNGANFGPDTPGTVTNGIQEALNSIPSGGYVYCLNGSYSASAAIKFTGSYQRLEFEAGSMLTFSSHVTANIPVWFNDGGSGLLAWSGGLIHMGSALATPTVYSHQWFIGNGLQINWGSNTQNSSGGSAAGNNGNNTGFAIMLPGGYSNPSYSGAGGQDYRIEGVVMTGSIWNQIVWMEDWLCDNGPGGPSYNSTPPSTTQQSGGLVVRDVIATYGADPNATQNAGIFISGGFNILIERVRIDMSAFSGVGNNVDADPILIRGTTGECYDVTVRHCYFRLYQSLSFSSGSVIEVQGCGRSELNYAFCHDIVFDQCTLDANGSSTVYAGGGGGYIDDTNGTSSTGFVWNVDFRNCKWVGGAGVGYRATAGSISPASGASYANPYAFALAASISGGTVTAVSLIDPSSNTYTMPLPTTYPNAQYLVKPGWSIKITYTGTPTFGIYPFGFVRFSGTSPVADPSNAVLTARGPNWKTPGSLAAFVDGTAGLTTISYQNSEGFPEVLIVTGTIASVARNGATLTGQPQAPYYLQNGDTVSVHSTGTPILFVQPE